MKNELRSFFADVKDFIKFKPFLLEVGITPSAFSRFMKGEEFNYEISQEKLNNLYLAIVQFCENIV